MRNLWVKVVLYGMLSLTLPVWFLLALLVEIGSRPQRGLLKIAVWIGFSVLLAFKMGYPVIPGSLLFAYWLGYGYILYNRFRISLRRHLRWLVLQNQYRQLEAIGVQ